MISVHANWISDTLLLALEGIPSTTLVEVIICVTTTAENSQAWDDDSIHSDHEEKTSESKTSDPKIFSSPLVVVQRGRPNLAALISEETKQVSGAMSVNGQSFHPTKVQAAWKG